MKKEKKIKVTKKSKAMCISTKNEEQDEAAIFKPSSFGSHEVAETGVSSEVPASVGPKYL